MRYTVHPIHISLIRPGDTVEIEGALHTVSQNDIQTGGFMGLTLRGDSYRCGTVPVLRAVIAR